MSEVFLSVVIPCFDEMTNLQKGVLDKIIHFLNNKNFNYEIIVSDDGSIDGSIKFVENFIKENKYIILLKNKHLGKAGAVTKGVLKAKGKYILFIDMDQATPIEEVDKLLPFATIKNFDVVIGSRKTQRKGAPLSRLFISKALIVLRTLIVGLKGIIDTQCGFKLFTKDSASKLFNKIYQINNGFSTIEGSAVKAGFDIELLLIAQKNNMKIKEVPVNWLHVETRRVGVFKDSIDGLISLFKIKRNLIKGFYVL